MKSAWFKSGFGILFAGFLLLVLTWNVASAATPGNSFIEAWNSLSGWNTAGQTAEISPAGQLHLRNNNNMITSAYRTDKQVSPHYELGFRMKIQEFPATGEIGMKVQDGMYRLLLYFKPDGVYAKARTGTTVKVLNWPADQSFHDWKVVVQYGVAKLFKDGVSQAEFTMQRFAGTSRIEPWVLASSGTAEIYIDTTSFANTYENNWEDLSGWTASGQTVTINPSGYARIYNNSNTISQVYASHLEVPLTYKFETRMKIVQFPTSGEVGLKIQNGLYRLMLYFTPSGIYVTNFQGTNVSVYSGPMDSDWHVYRVDVKDGMLKFYRDGAYLSSSSVRTNINPDHIAHWVKAETGEAEIHIDYSILGVDTFSYEDNFKTETVGQDPSHWMEKSGSWSVQSDSGKVYQQTDAVSATEHYSLLHVLSKDLVFEGKVKVNSRVSDSAWWLMFRWNSKEALLRAGYNYSTGRWEIQGRDSVSDSMTLLAQSGAESISDSTWYDVKVYADGTTVKLFVNGLLKASTTASNHNTYGRIGVVTYKANVSFDDFLYTGNGRVNDGVYEMTMYDGTGTWNEFTMDIAKLANGDLIAHYESSLGRLRSTSTNNGLSWSTPQTFTGITGSGGTNVLRLSSGVVIEVFREQNPDDTQTFRDFVVRSSDGQTWETTKYYIQSEYKNRITMNGKIMQTSTGRIIYTSGETGHGQENEGAIRVYYSDDDGLTWTASATELSYASTGINLQEGRPVEIGNTPDVTLRMYVRTDKGYLYETFSYDNGETWSTTFSATVFTSSLCAFNVEKDVTTGHLYMFWTYEDANKYPTAQLPRERMGLARSTDNGQTWQYVMDVDDWEGTPWRFLNAGIRIFDGYLYMNVTRRERLQTPNAKVFFIRVDISKLEPYAEFPGTHH